jgi:hypothetical protein
MSYVYLRSASCFWDFLNTVTMCDKLTIWWPYDFLYMAFFTLLPVAARSQEWVSGRSLVKNSVSKPTESMDVCFDCCVQPGRGLCDELITRPEESYRVCVCMYVCVRAHVCVHSSVARSNKNPLHLERAGRVERVTTKGKKQTSRAKHWAYFCI